MSEQKEEKKIEVRYVSDEASIEAFEMMRVRELADQLLENSEELSRRLSQSNYQAQSSYTRHFAYFLKAMTAELKKFRLEVQE